MDKLQDSHVKNVIQKYSERSQVGLLKYGTTLERTDLNNLQWLLLPLFSIVYFLRPPHSYVFLL